MIIAKICKIIYMLSHLFILKARAPTRGAIVRVAHSKGAINRLALLDGD